MALLHSREEALQMIRTGRPPQSPRLRFWNLVEVTDTCWNWKGKLDKDGYGRFFYGGKTGKAHRFSHELNIGPIPKGLTIDHLCRNRRCVRPSHLEPVFDKQNILRGKGVAAINAVKTHCMRGHEFTLENTRMSNDGRICRTCFRAYDREWKKRKRRERGHLSR